MRLPTRFPSLVVLAAGAVSGCGSGDGFGPGTAIPLDPTFDSIQANIFTPVCEQCHSGATAPLGLRLDPASSYALLVGVPSVQEPGLLRVQPGDPNNSYLVRKLEGTAGSGERMPAGLPPLPQSEIDVIRQWIADGAPATPAPVPGAIRVTSLAPLPNEVVTRLPASITVVFDREPNASTVTTATFVLERSGGDGSFTDGNEVAITPASVTVPATNLRSAVMDLTGVASVEDTYRVTLIGSGPTAILDIDGNALDGELGAALPSGDGAAGGDFTALFVVSGIQPTLDSLQTHVFTPRCGTSGCHTGGGTLLPAAMDLTNADATYASLVGVTSIQRPPLLRVAPDDPDESYVIHKLEGAPTIDGERMPFGGPYLDQATIDVIREWIADGAPQP